MGQPERWPVVLVADDDTSIRELIGAVIVGEAGLRVVLAADGAAALAAIASARPDVVVLDMQMPVVDGVEVAQRLRRDPATRAIPIVGISAGAGRAAALAAGCDAFVAKPFELDELVAAIHAGLRDGRGGGS